MSILNIFNSQKLFFETQATKSFEFRKFQLKKLRKIIIDNEERLCEAIFKDFGKSAFDTFTTEISMIVKDLDYYIKNLKKLMQPISKVTNLPNFPGSSYIMREPLGCTLIIGAWNYPYQLSLCPMVAAMAAGNCCIIKPSELPSNTMALIANLINNNFESNFLFVEQGGIPETTALLELSFDKIFFTGSTAVGKIVYQAAAKNLCPVTLELGGKSPAIVTENADLTVTAKRIVWGKFLNAGQTCVAPDYLYVAKNIKEKFINLLKEQISTNNYHANASHYTKIINDKNFNRLINLIDPSKLILGGNSDIQQRYIAPTLIDNVDWNDLIMQEEIFGPLLPIITFENFEESIATIRQKDKPLSAYLFSNNKKEQEYFINHLSCGGACINDVIMHLTNHHLPFGGVGKSGIGNYHGIYGFDTFSHQKAILKKGNWGEPAIKYPPYSSKKLKWIKKLL